MTDERIDINVTDNVDPNAAKKLRDIAAAAIEADSALDRLEKGSKDIDASAIDQLKRAASELTAETNKAAKANSVNKKATQGLTQANKLSKGQMQQVSFQLQDIITQLQSGTSVTTTLTQQLPQLAGAFGAVGAAIGVGIALGIPAVAVAMKLLNVETISYTDALEELEDAVDLLRQSNKEYSESVENLSDVYGGNEEAIRSLLLVTKNLREEQAKTALQTAANSISQITALRNVNKALQDTSVGANNTQLAKQQQALKANQRVVKEFGVDARTLRDRLTEISEVSTFEEMAQQASALREELLANGTAIDNDLIVELINLERTSREAMATFNSGLSEAEKNIEKAEKAVERLTEKFTQAGTTAELQLQFRTDPVGLAGALAEQEALRAQAPLRGAPGANIAELDAQVAAIRAQAEETEKLRQRTISLNDAERQRAADKRKADADAKRQADQKQRDDERVQRQAEAAFKRQQGQYDRLRSTILSFDDSEAGRIAQIREVEQKRVEIVKESLRQNVIDHAQAQADILAIQQQAARDINAVKFPGGEEILNNLRGPMMEYEDTIRTLNELMRLGKITAEEYNAVLANTSVGSGIQDIERLLKPDYELEIEDLNTFYEERFRIIDEARRADVANKEYYDNLQIELERKKQQEIVAIEQARHAMVIGAAGQGFGDLAQLAKTFAGEQSGIYRTLFAIHKGFATAEAIINTQQAVTKALAEYPVPINFVMAGVAAAQGAVAIAKINSAGFMDGGYTGNLPTNAIAGAVHGQEYVFDAASVRRIGVGNLEAMRRQSAIPAYRAPQSTFANDNRAGGTVNNGPVNVTIQTPDLRSFMASEGQVASQMARAVNRGQRNL